jgi:hypothetical protein
MQSKVLIRAFLISFTGDSSDEQAITNWMDRLPDGSVFINRDAQGRVLIENEPVYIIKGFKKGK